MEPMLKKSWWRFLMFHLFPSNLQTVCLFRDVWGSGHCFERPKSATRIGESRDLRRKRMFSNFKSRWQTFLRGVWGLWRQHGGVIDKYMYTYIPVKHMAVNCFGWFFERKTGHQCCPISSGYDSKCLISKKKDDSLRFSQDTWNDNVPAHLWLPVQSCRLQLLVLSAGQSILINSHPSRLQSPGQRRSWQMDCVKCQQRQRMRRIRRINDNIRIVLVSIKSIYSLAYCR